MPLTLQVGFQFGLQGFRPPPRPSGIDAPGQRMKFEVHPGDAYWGFNGIIGFIGYILRLSWGNIGIMEKKMETTIVGVRV